MINEKRGQIICQMVAVFGQFLTKAIDFNK
jgi:hypothetical protein